MRKKCILQAQGRKNLKQKRKSQIIKKSSRPQPPNDGLYGLVRGLQSGSDGAVNSCEVILIMMRIISMQTGVVEPLRPARLRALLLQLHCS